MAYETPNAVKSVARRCNNEIKKALQKKPHNITQDQITRQIILKHYEEIKPLNIKLGVLLLAIGILNKQFEER